MSTQAQTREHVRQLPAGVVFGYGDLPSYTRTPTAVAKAMSRLVQQGELRRFSKGRFYRPKKGVLGEQTLPDSEKLRPFLYRSDQRIGYITGARLYNRLGLTTQIPKTVTVAWGGSRQEKTLGTLRLKLVTARAPVCERDLPLLELLDALKEIRHIPDTEPAETLDALSKKIAELDDKQQSRMIRLAVNYYPPAARALLGVVLDVLTPNGVSDLQTSLNPLTCYNVGLAESHWATAAKPWKVQ